MTRDLEIVGLYKSGISRTNIAKRFTISGERVSQILLGYGIPRERRQSTSRRERVITIYRLLVQHKLEHDGNTVSVRSLASFPGNHIEGVYVALETLERMGLIKREGSDVLIIGGKWIPPEEPDWEELL